MKKLIAIIAVSAGIAATGIVRADAVQWDFPRLGSCHEGLAFGDGVTGVLVWGGGDEIRLTVGRADLWDHRGGYPWTPEQSYTNIVAAVRSGDKDRLYGLFKKNVLRHIYHDSQGLAFAPPKNCRSGISCWLGGCMLDRLAP